jgi:hypothetical protein
MYLFPKFRRIYKQSDILSKIVILFSGSSCLCYFLSNFTDEGLSQNKFWTSGELSWNSTPCIGDLTINWCSGQQNTSTLWWKSKFPSLSSTDAGKQVALTVISPPETSTFNLMQYTAELPFLCKVQLQLNHKFWSIKLISIASHSVHEKIAVLHIAHAT